MGVKHHFRTKISCITHLQENRKDTHQKQEKHYFIFWPPFNHYDVIEGPDYRKTSSFRLDDTSHSIPHIISFQKI